MWGGFWDRVVGAEDFEGLGVAGGPGCRAGYVSRFCEDSCVLGGGDGNWRYGKRGNSEMAYRACATTIL